MIEVGIGQFLRAPFWGALVDADGSLVVPLCGSTCKAPSELQGGL